MKSSSGNASQETSRPKKKGSFSSPVYKVVKQKYTVKHLKTDHQWVCQSNWSFCPKQSLSSCSVNKEGMSRFGYQDSEATQPMYF